MQAEELLTEKRVALESPEVVRDPHRLQQALRECDAAQSAVEALYSRWGELEVKLGNISEAAWKDN